MDSSKIILEGAIKISKICGCTSRVLPIEKNKTFYLEIKNECKVGIRIQSVTRKDIHLKVEEELEKGKPDSQVKDDIFDREQSFQEIKVENKRNSIFNRRATLGFRSHLGKWHRSSWRFFCSFVLISFGCWRI